MNEEQATCAGDSRWQSLNRYLREFASVRDWRKFHSPKNLAMALLGEAGELLEHFQWQPVDAGIDDASLAEIADEMADVQIYLMRLADELGVDLLSAVDKKMQRNEKRFAVDKVKGRADKIPE